MCKLVLALLLPPALFSAILPEFVGTLHKTSSNPLPVEDRAVWDEYGLQDSELATYQGPAATLTVRAYRLQDATGALAAFQWQHPAGARPAAAPLLELSKLAVETPTGETIALGNHLLILDGYKPTPDDLANVFRSLPRQEAGRLPSLPDHLPDPNLEPGSERYITGPASLAKFDPDISSSQAAFHLGTEIQTGTYKSPSGPLKLSILSFPSPEIARLRTNELEKIPGAIVKRSGPLVATVFSPKDPNEAEKLLAQVRYQAAVTTGQPAPTKKDNFGDFLLNLFMLIGIVILFCVGSGLVFGAFRHTFRRGGPSGDGETVISLHLGDQ